MRPKLSMITSFGSNCVCGRTSRTSSGLRRHIAQCKASATFFKERDLRRAQKVHARRESERHHLPTSSTPASANYNEAMDEEDGEGSALYPPLEAMEFTEYADHGALNDESISNNNNGWQPEMMYSSGPQNYEDEGENERHRDESSDDNASDSEPGDVPVEEYNEQYDNLRRAAQSTPSTTRSSSAVNLEETYEEVEKEKAGVGRSLRRDDSPELRRYVGLSAPEVLAAGIGAEFATLLWRTKSTKGTADEFIRNRRLAEKLELPFKNADEWLRWMESLPCGPPRDWISHTVRGTIGGRAFLYYGDVLDRVRFLLGHEPFAPHLHYQPVRQYNADNKRIYAEFFSADCMWELQKQVPAGGTVVPLLLSSDKTMLSQHGGDKVAWPVYITIGNLESSVRRAGNRPGMLLLGLIPAMKAESKVVDENVKHVIWHEAVAAMLEPLERYADEGIEICCADGMVRTCFLKIAGFSVDYPEQCLITGVKSGRCPTCKVKDDEREKILVPFARRTHEDTKAQVRLMREKKLSDREADVKQYDNFAWKHGAGLNIHRTMMPDNLHQLHKGLVMNLMDWITLLLADKDPETTRSDWSLKDSKGVAKAVDARFRAVPAFKALKHFHNYSQVSQWTGKEQKALVRILVPVFAPLLLAKKHRDALYCAQALVDFVLSAGYYSHDEDTLRYMELALRKFAAFVEAFRKVRKDEHFNYPKFHALCHYVDQIRYFGAATHVSTEHSEHGHILFLKDFYKRTNKRDGFEVQILRLNAVRTTMLAYEDITLQHLAVAQSAADKRQVQERRLTRPAGEFSFDTSQLRHWTTLAAAEKGRMRRLGVPGRLWRSVSDMLRLFPYDGLADAIAVFVRESRRTWDGGEVGGEEVERVTGDTGFVQECLVRIYPSARCWHADGKDLEDTCTQVSELVHCSTNFLSVDADERTGRRDFVWLQEYAEGGTDVLNGRRIGQLKVILTVLDPTRRRRDGSGCAQYSGVFVELLSLVDKKDPFGEDNLLEVQWNLPKHQDGNAAEGRPASIRKRRLGPARIYQMSTVLRSAHVIPTGKERHFYVNTTIDFNTYNEIYDPRFEEKGERAVADANKRRAKSSRR